VLKINKEEQYRNYRKKWNEMPKHFIQEALPCNIDLELTTHCNLYCDFCPRTQLGLKSEHMDLDLAKSIIEEFAEKGGCSIKFVYLGEPLMYPYLTEIIKYSHDLGIIDTIVSTNGNLLTYEKTKELVESGLDFIIISADSFRPLRYESIRRGGNLSRVIRGIVYLELLKKNMKPRVQIQAIPISPFNDIEINSKEYELFWEPFVDSVQITPYLIDYEDTTEIKEIPPLFCPSPFRRFLVRVNGDIALCCGNRSDSKVIGNYREMTLEEAWNGDFIKDVRDKLKKGKINEIEACKHCSFIRMRLK